MHFKANVLLRDCIMKKLFSFVVFFTAYVCLISSLNAAPQHGMAMHGGLKYPENFTHFDIVNPNAPKGGELRLAIVGTYDTLNPFILKGTPPAGIRDIMFDSLMKRSPDEPFSLYGLVADSVDMAPDRSWVIYTINPKAKWQ